MSSNNSSRTRRWMTSGFKFSVFTFFKVPLLWLSGVKIARLEDESCEVLVPFKRRNLNPFKSIYFAVESMGAELSTAIPVMIAIEKLPPKSMAYIVVSFNAQFYKKADAALKVICVDFKKTEKLIQEAYESGEAKRLSLDAKAYLPNGELAAEFQVGWSFKKRR